VRLGISQRCGGITPRRLPSRHRPAAVRAAAAIEQPLLVGVTFLSIVIGNAAAASAIVLMFGCPS
jgi:hypothetical protein